MAARSIASLSISFGLVNIPVRLYSATESSASVKFNMLRKDGSRLKQQYVADVDGKVVPRDEMVKGYEFEKDHFVMFAPEEAEGSRGRRQSEHRNRVVHPGKVGRPRCTTTSLTSSRRTNVEASRTTSCRRHSVPAASARWPSGRGNRSSTLCRFVRRRMG